MSRQRKKYTEEFKLSAVKMIVEQGRSVREVAQNLDVNETTLHSWKRKAMSEETESPGKLTSKDEEIRRLRRELANAKKDQEILKKAAAYLAKNQK